MVFFVDLDYDDIDLEGHTLAFYKDNEKVCYTGKYYILSWRTDLLWSLKNQLHTVKFSNTKFN